VTLVFTSISYFAIVVSFILISTDDWFPYCAWPSVLFLFISRVIWNDNELETLSLSPVV